MLLGKKLLPITALLIISGFSIAFANPQGETVVAGSATFDRSTPDTLNVTTPSDKLIVNYDSFNIAQNETVRFQQPSSDAVVLNRVIGADPSAIYGQLLANGKLFLINPNGVLFGAGSRVDAAALVASTLNISNEDFLKGNYNFFKNGESAFILNQGAITARPGGYVCLLSQAVQNSGIIVSELGSVVLACGEKTTLALDNHNVISVVVDEAVKSGMIGINSAVKNSGTIIANGGRVILTAKVLNNVFDYAVNNSGIIQAKSLANHNGTVELTAEGAPVINTGKIETGSLILNLLNSAFINNGEIITDSSVELPKIDLSAEFANALTQPSPAVSSFENRLKKESAAVSIDTSALDQTASRQASPVIIIGNNTRALLGSFQPSARLSQVYFRSNNHIRNTIIGVSSFSQLGFFGILSSRAPPGSAAQASIFTPSNINPSTNLSKPSIPQVNFSNNPSLSLPIYSGHGLNNKNILLTPFCFINLI